MDISPYTQHPNVLAQHYRHFRVSDRILLTGHSHQAWPDCSKTGQLKAWQDATDYVDKKWDVALNKADQVKSHFLRLLDDDSGAITLGTSTHELLVKFLSALPLKQRPKIVTTDCEFYTMQRQLTRMEQKGLEIIRIASQPYDQLPSRLIDALDDKTAALMVSSVFFNSGFKLLHLPELVLIPSMPNTSPIN